MPVIYSGDQTLRQKQLASICAINILSDNQRLNVGDSVSACLPVLEIPSINSGVINSQALNKTNEKSMNSNVDDSENMEKINVFTNRKSLENPFEVNMFLMKSDSQKTNDSEKTSVQDFTSIEPLPEYTPIKKTTLVEPTLEYVPVQNTFLDMPAPEYTYNNIFDYEKPDYLKLSWDSEKKGKCYRGKQLGELGMLVSGIETIKYFLNLPTTDNLLGTGLLITLFAGAFAFATKFRSDNQKKYQLCEIMVDCELQRSKEFVKKYEK